jgi:hypothetical protein
VHACWSEGEQLGRTNGLTTNDTAGGSGNAPASVLPQKVNRFAIYDRQRGFAGRRHEEVGMDATFTAMQAAGPPAID